MVLMQADFREGRMEQESTWQAVVLLPKGGGDYYDIGLAEVVWKVVTVMIHCTTFFYMEYSLFAYTDPEWMQGAFETLTWLFERVGLQKNTRMTVGMLY